MSNQRSQKTKSTPKPKGKSKPTAKASPTRGRALKPLPTEAASHTVLTIGQMFDGIKKAINETGAYMVKRLDELLGEIKRLERIEGTVAELEAQGTIHLEKGGKLRKRLMRVETMLETLITNYGLEEPLPIEGDEDEDDDISVAGTPQSRDAEPGDGANEGDKDGDGDKDDNDDDDESGDSSDGEKDADEMPPPAPTTQGYGSYRR